MTGLVADDGAHQAGFANAIAAQHAGDLGFLNLKIDAAQGLGRAIMQTCVLDIQHFYRPK